MNTTTEYLRRAELLKAAELDPALQEALRLFVKTDICAFVDNFCWIYEPRAGREHTLPWKLYPHEIQVLDWLEERFTKEEDGLIEKSRDMGATWTLCVWLLWHFLFESEFSALIGSRKEDLVDNKLPDSIFGKIDYLIDHLPTWLLPIGWDKSKNRLYMKITNSENLNSITGESTNAAFSRSGRFSCIVLDEFAFVERSFSIWQAAGDSTSMRVPISCVSGDSIIFTDQGMRRMIDVQPGSLGFTEGQRIALWGREGIQETTTYYNSGVQNTRRITTEGGYSLECSLIHPLLTLRNGLPVWKRSRNLKVGDYVALQYDQKTFGVSTEIPTTFVRGRKPIPFKDIDSDVAYFLGLFLAEGYIHQGHQVIITNGDGQIHDFLKKYGFRRADKWHSRLSNTNLCDWLVWYGFSRQKAPKKIIPDNVLQLPRECLVSFLQGLFDGDGTSDVRNGTSRVAYTSTSSELLKTLQVILLNFGLVSRVGWGTTVPTKKVKVSSSVGNLSMNGWYSARFQERIGFRLKRKMRYAKPLSDSERIPSEVKPVLLRLLGSCKRGTTYHQRGHSSLYLKREKRISRQKVQTMLDAIQSQYPASMEKTYQSLREVSDPKLVWLKVTKIENSRAPVYDFSIPVGHSFTAHGFVGHNTPNGKGNKFAELAMGGQISKLSLHWRLHPEKDDAWYEKEKTRRTNEEIAQELDISYDRSQRGRVFKEEWEELVRQGRLTNVPYDPMLPVYTSWDFGIGDATAIGFYQEEPRAGVIRLIDYYENNGFSVDHYIKVVQGKPYRYFHHYGDMTITRKEFGTGHSVWEILKANGITIRGRYVRKKRDTINAAKMLMRRLYVDKKCTKFVDAVENYHYEWLEERQDFSEDPVHDWSSHSSDQFGYFAFNLKTYEAAPKKMVLDASRFRHAATTY